LYTILNKYVNWNEDEGHKSILLNQFYWVFMAVLVEFLDLSKNVHAKRGLKETKI
jgi:hypothetical protein